MSERGIVVTDAIYDDELREAVFALVKNWQKGAAIVCLSVVAAPGGLYAGCEKEDTLQLAEDISEFMSKRPDDFPETVRVVCIPDSDDVAIYLVSSSGVRVGSVKAERIWVPVKKPSEVCP
jgi:hypothetical protein